MIERLSISCSLQDWSCQRSRVRCIEDYTLITQGLWQINLPAQHPLGLANVNIHTIKISAPQNFQVQPPQPSSGLSKATEHCWTRKRLVGKGLEQAIKVWWSNISPSLATKPLRRQKKSWHLTITVGQWWLFWGYQFRGNLSNGG